MTQDQHYDANKRHNIQIIEFCDGSKYVTARSDARTREDIMAWKRAIDHFTARSEYHHVDKNALSLKLDTHTIRQITNVEGLQGMSKGCALASKHALIKGLRALGHAVINGATQEFTA
jgi:hypothetical protein